MLTVRKLAPCFVVLAFLSGATFGAWQPLTGDPVTIASLEAQPLPIVLDKEFTDFEVIGIGQGGALPPSAESILVQGGYDDVTNDIGLRFVLSWNAFSGQVVDAVISFKVSVIPGIETEDLFIKDVSMILVGAAATGTGGVVAGESVWSAPIPDGQVLAWLEVAKQPGDGGVDVRNYAEFAPVKEIWIYKDIAVTGGIEGSAGLSDFFQFYSQIPEPTSLCLLALGLGLLRRRRR